MLEDAAAERKKAGGVIANQIDPHRFRDSHCTAPLDAAVLGEVQTASLPLARCGPTTLRASSWIEPAVSTPWRRSHFRARRSASA